VGSLSIVAYGRFSSELFIYIVYVSTENSFSFVVVYMHDIGLFTNFCSLQYYMGWQWRHSVVNAVMLEVYLVQQS